MPDRLTLMLQHGMRREHHLTNIVLKYHNALALIAQKIALHPNLIAAQALRESLTIMTSMQEDPWPPSGPQHKSAD